jgi:hypothetical protein
MKIHEMEIHGNWQDESATALKALLDGSTNGGQSYCGNAHGKGKRIPPKGQFSFRNRRDMFWVGKRKWAIGRGDSEATGCRMSPIF